MVRCSTILISRDLILMPSLWISSSIRGSYRVSSFMLLIGMDDDFANGNTLYANPVWCNYTQLTEELSI